MQIASSNEEHGWWLQIISFVPLSFPLIFIYCEMENKCMDRCQSKYI